MSPRDGGEVDSSTVFSLKDLPLLSFSCCYIVEIHRIGNALLYYKKSRQRRSVVTMATRHLRLSTLLPGRLFFFELSLSRCDILPRLLWLLRLTQGTRMISRWGRNRDQVKI